MNVDFATLASGVLNELDCVVENALDLFPHMILEVILFVFNRAIEVVSAVICGTVDHMRYSMLAQYVLVLSDEITTEV